MNALAYTVGRDVVLGAEQYIPTAHEGRRLLAHELTHVIQQKAGAWSGLQRQGEDEEDIDNAPEKEAEDTAEVVALRGKAGKKGPKKAPTKKKEKPKKCKRMIFAEGTCQHLVDKAAGRCCDPDKGLLNPKVSIEAITHPNHVPATGSRRYLYATIITQQRCRRVAMITTIGWQSRGTNSPRPSAAIYGPSVRTVRVP